MNHALESYYSRKESPDDRPYPLRPEFTRGHYFLGLLNPQLQGKQRAPDTTLRTVFNNLVTVVLDYRIA